MVKSIRIYGSEIWKMTKKTKGRILATEIDYLKRSCGINKPRNQKNVKKK